jgi:hypothetical protein
MDMSAATPSYLLPKTASGQRNWSHAAVNPTQNWENRNAPPQVEGDFMDLLDIINPLQHIPVVSTIYRAITGDTINPVGNIMGGMLFGGPLGFLSGIGNTLMAQATGGDVGDHLLAALTDSSPAVTAQSASAHYDKSSRLADTFADKNVIKI